MVLLSTKDHQAEGVSLDDHIGYAPQGRKDVSPDALNRNIRGGGAALGEIPSGTQRRKVDSEARTVPVQCRRQNNNSGAKFTRCQSVLVHTSVRELAVPEHHRFFTLPPLRFLISSSSSFRILSRPSFRRANSMTSSVLILVLPAWLANAPRSVATFPTVQTWSTSAEIHTRMLATAVVYHSAVGRLTDQFCLPSCAQTNSVSEPMY